MAIDVFFDFFDPSSGQLLDLDAVLDAVESETADYAYHSVHRRGHLFLIGGGLETEKNVRLHSRLHPDSE